MERRKYLSIVVSIVFLLASVVFSYLSFSGDQNLRTILTRASTSTLACPTGTSLLFPTATTLAVNSLVGAGGKVIAVKTGSVPWTVGTRSGVLVAERGQMISVSFTKEVMLDSAFIYDNDHDPGWTINGKTLTKTANETWAALMKLGIKTDVMTFNGNGDSSHFNVCVGAVVTNTPTKTPTPSVTKTPTPSPTKSITPSITPTKTPTITPTKTPTPTCIPLPSCAWPGANPICDLAAPPAGGSYCPAPTATKTPTPTTIISPTATKTPSPTINPLCKLSADIVLILDRSSSMNSKESDGRTKLAWAKEAALRFTDKIAATSGITAKIGIVSFGAQGNDGTGTLSADNNSTLHIKPSSDWESVRTAINSVQHIQGGTCIECGLRIANEQLTTQTRNRIVILLSDGQANRTWTGSSSNPKPAAIAEAEKGRTKGIKYYVLGYGSSVDAATLKSIAGDATHYQYMPNTADWEDAYISVFEQECQEPTATPTPAQCIVPVKVKNIKIICPNCKQPTP